MIWVFAVLTIAGIAITIRLVIEYVHESRDLQTATLRVQHATAETQSKIEEHKAAKIEADQKVAELSQISNQLNATATDLLARISSYRKGRESRGKFAV